MEIWLQVCNTVELQRFLGRAWNNFVLGGSFPVESLCPIQVMMVEETVYDEVVTCDHSYDRRCHTSYKTSFQVVHHFLVGARKYVTTV